MRVATKMSNYTKQWILLNDSEIKLFADMNEVITYCVESGACPTVVIYEKQELVQGVTFEQSKKIQTVLNEDQLLMLTCIAKGKDDNVNDYAANEEAMKQQREIESQI